MFSLPCVNIQTSEYEPRSRVTDIFITTTGSSQQRCRLYCTDITQNEDEDVITLHIHDHKLFVDTVFDKAEAAERIFPLSTIAGRPEMTYGSVHNSATFPVLLLKSSKKVVNLNEISRK